MNGRLICFLLPLLGLCLSNWNVVADDRLSLVVEGKSRLVITLPAAAAPSQQMAAKELQEHLRQITVATLPIVAENNTPADASQIVLGPSPRCSQLLPDVDLQKLGPDSIVIKTIGDKLVLAWRPPRGTLYAVCSFLEDIWRSNTKSAIIENAMRSVNMSQRCDRECVPPAHLPRQLKICLR